MHPTHCLICAQVLWITLALLTLAKFITNFAFVVREWRDPVRVYFFANFHGGRFRGVPVSVLGYALVMLSVLLLSGPKLAGEPKLLGSYWAYVFPVAALGSACINYAAYENSPEAKAVAWVVFIIAEILLILVFVRTMYHWAQVARGRALWRDPLAPASAWVDEKTGGRVGHCEGDDAAITPA